MSNLPKGGRRPLKMVPDPDVMLAELVRSLTRIADGVESIVTTFDGLLVEGEDGKARLRVVNE